MLASSLTVEWKRYCFMLDNDLEMKYRILNFLSKVLRTYMWFTTSTTMKKTFKEIEEFFIQNKTNNYNVLSQELAQHQILRACHMGKRFPLARGSSYPHPNEKCFLDKSALFKSCHLSREKIAMFPRKREQIKLVKGASYLKNFEKFPKFFFSLKSIISKRRSF